MLDNAYRIKENIKYDANHELTRQYTHLVMRKREGNAGGKQRCLSDAYLSVLGELSLQHNCLNWLVQSISYL